MGMPRNPRSPIRPRVAYPAGHRAPSKYPQMNSRPGELTWYSRAPASLATVECGPSAPTTRGARITPLVVRTPRTAPLSCTRPCTVVSVNTRAPASSAASIRRASNVNRRMHNHGASNRFMRSGSARSRAESITKLPWSRGGAPVASSLSINPRRARRATPFGWIMCVDGTSLGIRARSTRHTFIPRLARSVAKGAPAQRAPTTITSNCAVSSTRVLPGYNGVMS